MDEFITTDDPNIISFVPILQSSTYHHGLGTNRYLFNIEYHSQSLSPLETLNIPLVSPVPGSPSYHVRSPSPVSPLLQHIRSLSPLVVINGTDQDLVNQLQRYTHPRPPFVKNCSDGRLCITTLIRDTNNNKGRAKYVQFVMNDSNPCTLLTMGRGHLTYAIKLQAQPHDGAQSPFHLFHQHVFEHGQPYQHLVNRALHSLGNLFIEGEVLQFRQLTQELLEAQQEVIDACTKVHHAQQVEMLATSALAAARQAVDASAARFKQAGAYQVLHPHLFQQSFCHVGNDAAIINSRNLLHCQLQAGGRPSSPDINSHGSPVDLDELMAQFNDTPTRDQHKEPFFQDGGDDDGY